MIRIATILLLLGLPGVAAVSCSNGPTDPRSSALEPASSFQPEGSIQAGNDYATLSQQLNAVRSVTRRYRDIEQARADGYIAVSPYVPGMGFHFAADLPPFGTDLEKPGVLVYFTNGSYRPAPGEEHDPAHDDNLILGAVEWLVPGDQTGTPPNIFMDEASPRRLRVTEAEGWHFESEEGFSGLHAWVHRDNPEGVFHTTNPTID